jgi:integrase/recombinase XerD
LPAHSGSVNNIGVLTPDELTGLYDSWLIQLHAERKSQETIKSYSDGVRLFLAWCARTGTPPALDRRTVSAWVAHLLADGAQAATARARQLAVRRFSAWLADEQEIDRDELLGVKPPKLDNKVVDSLTDEQLRALVAACKGREFRDRRDEAIVRLMAESALRSEELLSMTIPDTRIGAGVAVVRRGKGGKGRTVPFQPQTGAAVDRYVRARRGHRLAGTPTLWLGDRGKEFRYHALRDTLRYRAELAGLKDFHPHQLRHTAASRWLDAGGSEGGLMAVAGWTRRDMIDRYVKSTSERRAADEARRLNLGDI